MVAVSRLGGLALLSLIGACASDPAGGRPADAGYVPPRGQEAELCSIVPIDHGGAPSSSAACPATPPSVPASTYVHRSSVCRPGCTAPAEPAVEVGGAACDTREAHPCPPAQPGMTRYERLTAALDVLADDCGLSGPGSGASVLVWFEGGCVRQLALRQRESEDAVRDCLVQKLRSLRLDCAGDFPCASVGRMLD